MYPRTYKKKYKNTQGGFSLVELMVSLTIFAIVMTVSIGTLLVMIDANSKAQSLYSVMTNLSFAVDNITRNIRTGNEHYCDPSVSATGNGNALPGGSPGGLDCAEGHAIAFSPGTYSGGVERIGYRYIDGKSIEQKQDMTAAPGSWINITGDEVTITAFDVVVANTDTYWGGGDMEQPEISLFIKGYVNNGLDTNTDFSLQTKVVRRILDY